jgi:hypothetical protein
MRAVQSLSPGNSSWVAGIPWDNLAACMQGLRA